MDLRRELKVTAVRVEKGHVRDAGPTILHPGSEVNLVRSLGEGYEPPEGFTWIAYKGHYYEVSDSDIAKAMTDPL